MRATPHQAERLHRFSHDLRNRLIGLQQALERLKESAEVEEREEVGRYGEQQFFKALREVEQLMADMEVPRGTPVLAPQEFDLTALVNERIDLLRYRSDRKGIRILSRSDPGLLVTADPRAIGEVVDALLTNAFKFSAPGAEVEVDLSRTPEGVALQVRDHGVGLSANDLAQVFERFAWLGSRPTAGESQGRGTLARMHAVALAHKGTLRAESPGEGAGCTFTLCLPG